LGGLLTYLDPADRALLAQFLTPRPVPPSRRRPRRDHAVTYRVHVQINGTDPLVWRRIELSSDLCLDDVHHVLQRVMGWSDDHLHHFVSGDDMYGPDSERYLMPYSIDQGSVGIDERTVRLDEVLVEPGDQLWYEYDFGDSWAHLLELEEVVERDPDAPSARCLAGARACPPEDCGGIWGYDNILRALADPPGPDEDELHERLAADFDPASFDPDRVKAALTRTRVG